MVQIKENKVQSKTGTVFRKDELAWAIISYLTIITSKVYPWLSDLQFRSVPGEDL